jgi:hypothetical protein
MFTSDTSVFTHGGLGSNGYLNDMWKFNTVAKQWHEV